ncbi:uncharacterized protein LOC133876754 [Alnus glutinosa]|uniref:uncharacterized protein LOC133876753 n=1 Tax=Alnus glutinosa TaxID=3517 RepID=UPI002D79B915|nr:uncharacterized protein LOC133876753 [Alnus glutinosa]XP_062170985.1 uncharacterized protein LOC133876754 [Alnus glutinosa]
MVRYATFKLTAEAERWWTSKKDHLQQQVGEGVPITWKDFKDAFMERFFPQSVRLAEAQEFTDLVQGSSTVEQYAARFIELRFAPYLVPTEDLKEESAPQGSRYGGNSHDHNKRRFNPTVGRNTAHQQPHHQGGGGQRPMCQTCGKIHSGRSRLGQSGCYRCGGPGHLAKDCRAPTNNPTNQNRPGEQRNTTPAHVYDLTPGDAATSNKVVIGTLLISPRQAIVLFDSGATHSFVSHSFSRDCNLMSEWLDVDLAVNTPVGKTAICTSVVRKCSISVQGHVMPANLVTFKMSRFNVILGMDWLSMYHACVDCFCKEVVFKPPGAAKFKIQGKRGFNLPKLVSAMQATQLLKQGCSGFLACVTKEAPEAKLEEIPIVRDFVDVFPEELPGLPPDREIELL